MQDQLTNYSDLPISPIRLYQEEFFKEGLSFFPKREEQQAMFNDFESEFIGILGKFIAGHNNNRVTIGKLLKLLESFEFFEDPYIFDKDIIEEAIRLDLIITDMITAIS